MIPHRTRFGLVACLLALLAAPATAADDGFKPLFNGKDFTGWTLPSVPGLFTIEGDEIVGRTGSEKLKKNEFLVTDRPYANFTLKAKVKLLEGNSGIQFRSDRAPDGAVSGPQADAADGYWGLFYEERRRGILERYPEAEAAKIARKGDWNAFEITAIGDHVVILLNGTKVIDRVDPKFAPKGSSPCRSTSGPSRWRCDSRISRSRNWIEIRAGLRAACHVAARSIRPMAAALSATFYSWRAHASVIGGKGRLASWWNHASTSGGTSSR